MSEAIIPAGVVLIIASMVVPLPAGVMDFLLVGNLVLALLLLVSTFFISDSLRLSSLPALLLLATLYRLALNISTTRLILGSGYAGEVVSAFGSAVIGQNLIVGAVIFIVITLVQYIVIAKGSERVAEVSARFTLDALPGRQMSIDADVRSGLIDFENARKKRQQLQTESRFYGALDGAMKFVKGDAICGMIIATVNIVGGLIIAILFNGVSIAEAFSTYTRLTIGDGLLSQLPALLNALAAGIVVTRVSSDDGVSLAGDLYREAKGHVQARVAIGVMVSLLSLLPGIPTLPFLAVGVILLGSCVVRSSKAGTAGDVEIKFTPSTPPLLTAQIDGYEGTLPAVEVREALEKVRQTAFETIGLMLPAPFVRIRSDGEKRVTMLLRGIPLKTLSFESLELRADHIGKWLQEIVEQHAPELIDDITTRRALDYLEQHSPELVAAVIPQIITVTRLTWILRELVEEKIPIKLLDLVLQAISECAGKGYGDRVLLEEVRVALRRTISNKFAPNGSLDTWVLSPMLDMEFMRAERENGTLDASRIAQLEQELGKKEQTGAIVLLVSKGARRLLYECLTLRGISIPVVAYEEIVQQVKVNIARHLDLNTITRSEDFERVVA